MDLERADLGHLLEPWAKAVRKGICTMAPYLGDWIKQNVELPPNGPLSLKNLVKVVVPWARDLTLQHHRAGVDAHMTWHLCHELAAWCTP